MKWLGLHVIRNNRKGLLVSALLFLTAWVIGSLYAQELLDVLKVYLDQLREAAEKIQANGGTPLATAWVIFLNNLLAMGKMILYGVAFAFLPFLMLLFNGLGVGMLLGTFPAALYGKTLLFGILPHGLFELFALFLAATLGMKIGYIWFVPLKGMTRLQSFLHVLREIRDALLLLFLLIALAAVIEGTLTPLLLETFVGR